MGIQYTCITNPQFMLTFSMKNSKCATVEQERGTTYKLSNEKLNFYTNDWDISVTWQIKIQLELLRHLTHQNKNMSLRICLTVNNMVQLWQQSIMVTICIKQIGTWFNIKFVCILKLYTYRRNTLQNPERKHRETLLFVFCTHTCSSTVLGCDTIIFLIQHSYGSK